MERFFWTQREDIGPWPRVGHSMSYDSDKAEVLLFVGGSTTLTTGYAF
jgi:hypothetical protein